MYTKRIIFFSCLTIIMNLANGDDPVSIVPGQLTDETEVRSLLHEITAEKALPLILFEVNSTLLRPPRVPEMVVFDSGVGFTSAQIKDGRLTSNTKFYSRLSNTPIYLCPKLHSETNEQCLAPKEFEISQILECDLEPIPKIRNQYATCGPRGTAIIIAFGYMICQAEEPYEYKDIFHSIYALCYNETSKKIITVSYYMNEVGLLEDKLFTREREIKFEMNTETYDYIDPNYYNNLEGEIQQKPQYMLQQLVPTEDMALATSRKTTQYFANFALQLEALTDVWNEIGKYFRDHAVQWKHKTFVRWTGVFDVPKNEITFQVNEEYKVNMWITIMTELLDDLSLEKGLAVIINNFIINDPKNQDADTSTSKQSYIDQLCTRNLCVDSLKKKFNAIGVEGRCCTTSEKIFKLFTGDELVIPTTLLNVENINS